MSDIASYIKKASKIVIVQADNPDGDSLSSSLALEQILTELDKNPIMYCGVDIPTYLRYMGGWDRVSKQLPNTFDLSIIVDNSSLMLLETLNKSDQLGWIKSKPCVVIDHHSTKSKLDFAKATYIKDGVSTTELIHDLAIDNNWPISKNTAEFIIYGILSDSLGLTTDKVSSANVRIVANMIDKGANLNELDAKRRELSKKSPELIKYKAKLLDRVDYVLDGQVAYIDIPWEEIEKYSPIYNPPMLVMDEMRHIENVKLSIAFKSYPDGRITAKIRSNQGFPISASLAEHFGGGGHVYASGFRYVGKDSLSELKNKVFNYIEELLK